MDCVGIPAIGYGTFSKRIHESAVRNRIPVSISVEATAKCNLDCLHCYIKHYKCFSKKEITLAEYKSIIDQIVDAGCLWLLLTGGDPFVRKDFMDMYIYAKRKGLLVSLCTNGTLIEENIAEQLADYPPFVVEITLYGRTKEVYEQITGVPGSFEKCMRSVDLLLDRDISVNLKSTVLTINRHELGDMQAFARSKNVDFRFDPIINRKLDGDIAPFRYRLTPEQVVDLDINDKIRTDAWMDLYNRYGGKALQPEYIYQCGAGISASHIDSFGKLSMCMMSRNPDYDLLQGNFQSGWNFLRQFREKKWTKETPCSKCNIMSLCNQCPGWSMLEHKNFETPVDYLCKVAHMRAELLGIESIIRK